MDRVYTQQETVLALYLKCLAAEVRPNSEFLSLLTCLVHSTLVYTLLLICVGSIPAVSIPAVSIPAGQVGLGVGSWHSNRATEGSNPKGTRLYFVILLNNVEKNL